MTLNSLTLDSGTLTPLLKKLEAQGYIDRSRGSDDERTVVLRLTDEGRALESAAQFAPTQALSLVELDEKAAQKLIDCLRYLTQRLS